MKKTLLIFALLIFSISFAQTKNDKIKELMVLTGAGDMGADFAKQLITQYKTAYSHVPEKFWTDFSSEIKASDLENLVIPIYDKYYSEQDINDLIKFYNSPVGKKTISVLPQIMRESMEAGQGWGRNISEKILEKLETEKYLQSPPPPMPGK